LQTISLFEVVLHSCLGENEHRKARMDTYRWERMHTSENEPAQWEHFPWQLNNCCPHLLCGWSRHEWSLNSFGIGWKLIMRECMHQGRKFRRKRPIILYWMFRKCLCTGEVARRIEHWQEIKHYIAIMSWTEYTHWTAKVENEVSKPNMLLSLWAKEVADKN
jgi:hypothetical protein